MKTSEQKKMSDLKGQVEILSDEGLNFDLGDFRIEQITQT